MQATRLYGTRVLVLAVLFGGIAGVSIGFDGAVYASAQNTRRSVQGRVVNASDAPLASAIVYLSDTQTKAVTSYITQEDGAYRFEQISPNDDYRLWAQLDGKKSRTKTLSSFDNRSVFHVILKIEKEK
jgi:hypothetical protein